jgi:hypothetical protein
VSTGELDERRRVDDLQRARLFGEEFRLGTFQRVSRHRDVASSVLWGGLFGAIVFFGVAPVTIGVDAGPYPLAAKVALAAVFGILFAPCCWLLAVGLARSPVTSRLFVYSGGLAQLSRDEPEPRVARWADVRDLTVDYHDAEDTPPQLDGFRVTTDAGTTVGGPRVFWRRERRDLLAAAERALAPRLVPAMTEAYESGGTVAFGRVQVAAAGITLPAGTSPGELIPWAQVKSIHLTYISQSDGDYVDEVIVGRKGLPTVEIGVSGLANGIFLPRLLVYAAARQGVLVTGYHKDGGGIPR